MMLKKILVPVLAVSALVSLSAFADQNRQEVTLTGAISKVACEVVLNGGASTLNVGTFPSKSFSTANKQVGSVPLNISLQGCSDASTPNKGAIYIQGTTANGSDSIFVNNSANAVGFMLQTADAKTVVNNEAIPLDVTAGSNTYKLTAGMGSTSTTPTNGVYSAPIVIAYVSD